MKNPNLAGLAKWSLIVFMVTAYAAAAQPPSWKFGSSQTMSVSPLYDAISEGNPSKVEMLLAKGADPNALASATDGKTLLMHAINASRGRGLDIVKLLIDAGANVNAMDKYNEPVLGQAVRSGSEQLIDLLIAKGAGINRMANYPGVKDAVGGSGLLPDVSYLMRCALDCAAPKFISLLQQGGDVLKQNGQGEDALSFAITAQRLDIVRAIFKQWRADKRKDLAQLLKPREHLLVAAATGELEIISILLSAGADPNVVGKLQETPLMVLLRRAAFEKTDWQRYLKAVKLLLKHGADPALTPSGNAPLSLAIATQRHEFVQAIVEAGGKTMAEPQQYIFETLWLAKAPAQEVEKIAELLLAHGARLDGVGEFGEGLLATAAHNTPYMVPWLVAHGLDNVNQRNSTGFTPIMYAADMGQAAAPIVPLLLLKGAEVNAKSVRGWTPLMFAARQGAHEIVAMLIEAGADINAKNDLGQTALTLVTQANALILPDKDKVIKYLLQAGAK